jgi:hypothetical protein
MMKVLLAIFLFSVASLVFVHHLTDSQLLESILCLDPHAKAHDRGERLWLNLHLHR